MFRKGILFTLVITLIIIVLSSYVRLSDVPGGGCPDWSGWPGCYAKSKALVSGGFTDASFVKKLFDDLTNFEGGLKQNSYLFSVGLLGALVCIFALAGLRQKQGRLSRITTLGLLLMLIALEVVIGLWGVELKIMPVVVSGHLLIGFVVFWLLFWLYLRANQVDKIVRKTTSLGLGLLTHFAMFVLLLQIIFGFWVSTNNAGLACVDFPQCNGQWVPNVDFVSALNLFSGLDSGYNGTLSFNGQVAVQWWHRVGTVICFFLLTLVMLVATAEAYPKYVRKSGVVLSILLLGQVLLGIFSIKLELPLIITLAHNALAAILMLPLIAINYYRKYAFEDQLESIDDVVLVDAVDTTTGASLDTSVVEVEKDVYVEPTAESLYLRLKTQLKKTRSGLGFVLSGISLGQKGIDEDLLEEIESSLLIADVGVDLTTEIISQLTETIDSHQLNDGEALETTLKQILLEILEPCSEPLAIPQQDTPYVILVVGINGVGKTTTIGKLAKRLQVQGHSVMLAAGDTFRAAAVEQLQTWGERNEIHVVAQHTGADSASVIFDGVQSAQAKGIDVLIADTAGRLHTKSNLMEELSKIKRIMGKVDAAAPHEVLLVLDAGTGQNALSQTKVFNETVKLTGLALTKLDGTAKGGVIFALAKQFGLPIRYIGVGEGIDDLQDFNAQAFVDALFVKD
ncbi:MAG: signal recognition particle-docking protein FtsY [Methylococcaceae bacterium]